MGDENSLAGTTKAHKHTSPASDGGFLETTETGVTNMSAGSIGYYSASSVLTELTAGNSADVLTMGATNPVWSAPTSSAVWDEILNEYDTSISNTLDTGFQSWGNYRMLKYIWSARYSSGVSALDVRFYNPDGNEETSANQGCSGFYNSNVFFARGNETSYNLTNANVIEDDADIILEITVLCASIANKGGGGYYTLSQRGASSYDTTYCSGNLFQAHNSSLVSNSLNYFCGIKNISSNVFTDGILTVLGMGDNTQ